MNILQYLAALMMACCTATLAANEKEILIHVRPISREQYESIMRISEGKPVISEGRLISSAISGLAGLAAGFQISKYFPSIFAANSQTAKGSEVLGGYPLCTISSSAWDGQENNEDTYLNIDELANSLAQANDSANDLPTTNCILVLDDGKIKPQNAVMTAAATAKPTSFEPAVYEPYPVYPYPPSFPKNYHPSSSQWMHPPFYPSYPYYPYPAPFYSMHQFPTLNELSSSAKSTTTKTKKPSRRIAMQPSNKPTKKSRRRSPSRPRSPPQNLYSSQSKTKPQHINDDFNGYDEY